jgi:hypothetical protein
MAVATEVFYQHLEIVGDLEVAVATQEMHILLALVHQVKGMLEVGFQMLLMVAEEEELGVLALVHQEE